VHQVVDADAEIEAGKPNPIAGAPGAIPQVLSCATPPVDTLRPLISIGESAAENVAT
jgi:hypothetical protein